MVRSRKGTEREGVDKVNLTVGCRELWKTSRAVGSRSESKMPNMSSMYRRKNDGTEGRHGVTFVRQK